MGKEMVLAFQGSWEKRAAVGIGGGDGGLWCNDRHHELD
jgi:hypothetical protein